MILALGFMTFETGKKPVDDTSRCYNIAVRSVILTHVSGDTTNSGDCCSQEKYEDTCYNENSHEHLVADTKISVRYDHAQDQTCNQSSLDLFLVLIR